MFGGLTAPLPELELSLFLKDSVILALKTKEEKILKNKKEKILQEKLVSNPTNYMESFRTNIDTMMDVRGFTLKELSEKADMPFETLKGFIYGDTKDCKLSTAIKLARAFGISVDRLVGAGTITEDVLEFMLKYKCLPNQSQALIRWQLDNQLYLHTKHADRKYITIMNPLCNGNGNMKQTNDYEQFEITNIGEEHMHKVFFGIRVPCEHYLPHYLEGSILLLANDRDAMRGENTVIIIDGNIVITRRVVENGIAKYYGIRDGIFRSQHKDHVQVIGYIAKVVEP